MADKRIFVTKLQVAQAFIEEDEKQLIPEAEREAIAEAFPNTPRSLIIAAGMAHIAYERGVSFFDIEVKG